jgi:hypothetical protein
VDGRLARAATSIGALVPVPSVGRELESRALREPENVEAKDDQASAFRCLTSTPDTIEGEPRALGGTLTRAAVRHRGRQAIAMISLAYATSMAAYNRWITSEPFVAKSLDQELYAHFEELRTEREATDAAIAGWVSTLSAAELARELCYTTMVKPQPKRYPLWLAVTHFFNHQTHHRGRVTTLLGSAGD